MTAPTGATATSGTSGTAARRASAWDGYRQILADPAHRGFSAAGLLARMPVSMTGLGVVLLVSLTTGSFGRAGLVAGVLTLTGALAAPWWGRLIDRIGQAPVLLAAAAMNLTGLAGVIAGVLTEAPLALICLAAALAGLGFSSAGSCVRARWAHRLSNPAQLNSAYALEGVLDEVVFMVGPVLATFVATTVHPAAALITAALVGTTGAVALAAQRRSEPPIRGRRQPGAVRARLPLALLISVTVAAGALGALFGGMEVVVVAYAKESGILAYAGLILMVWAGGSLLAGLVTGAVAWRASPVRRFRVGAVALALSMVPLVFVDQPLAVAGLLVLSGLAIAPTLIASVAVVQSSVPRTRLTEALGWTTMGVAAGVAAGAAGLGRVIDEYGAGAGFLGVAGVGALLIAAALAVPSARPATAQPGTPAAAPPPIEAGSRPR